MFFTEFSLNRISAHRGFAFIAFLVAYCIFLGRRVAVKDASPEPRGRGMAEGMLEGMVEGGVGEGLTERGGLLLTFG